MINNPNIKKTKPSNWSQSLSKAPFPFFDVCSLTAECSGHSPPESKSLAPPNSPTVVNGSTKDSCEQNGQTGSKDATNGAPGITTNGARRLLGAFLWRPSLVGWKQEDMTDDWRPAFLQNYIRLTRGTKSLVRALLHPVTSCLLGANKFLSYSIKKAPT